jgi:large subunit ribosomal protein L6
MSRIGKQPITIPDNVEVKIDKGEIKLKGPKGELTQAIPDEIEVTIKEKEIVVALKKKTKNSPALWGLLRTLIFNMIQGVTEGYEKQLEIEGVGYRATLQGNKLVLNIGFSHPVEIEAPAGIEFKVERNLITVSGIDKQLVGQVAAEIRSKRKPEPYKGKGIHYVGEVIRRKAGKKTAGTE